MFHFRTNSWMMALILVSGFASRAYSQDCIFVPNPETGKTWQYCNNKYIFFDKGQTTVEYVSSLPSGSISIQEKKLCPDTYHGGKLYFMLQNLSLIANATIFNGEPYLHYDSFNPTLPPGLKTSVSGTDLSASGPPFPEFGQTYTYTNLITPAAHVYMLTCHYNQGCPEEGPFVQNCSLRANHWVGINLNNPAPKVKITIDRMRVAQTVFEPSSTDGATTDLVTKKPYAVELTLSAEVPPQHKDLLARADLFVNGVFYLSSSAFKIGDIVNGQSKAFIFGQEDIAGSKTLRVDVVPVVPAPGAFDSTVSISRNVNFYDTQLSLLVSEITGCQPLISDCFEAPTTQASDFLYSEQVPLAESILPISRNGLKTTKGLSWEFSNPNPLSGGDSIYLDAAYIWVQKKLAMKDLGIGLVGTDYFVKHGSANPSKIVAGLVLKHQTNIGFVNSMNPATLAHELLHNFNYQMNHSKEDSPEMIGSSKDEIWTTGHSLDPSIFLGNLANNIFGQFLADSVPYGIGRPEYNVAFDAIRNKKIDPKVVLVVGVIGPNGESRHFQAHKGEALLDSTPVFTDLVVEGLNSNRTVVSTVSTLSSNEIEVIGSEALEVVHTPSSFFTATLPDDGTIKSIRVAKGTQIIVEKYIGEINLEYIIRNLSISSFNVKLQIAKSSLKIINVEFSSYLKSKEKHALRAAKIHLSIIREAIIRTCKDQILLENEIVISKEKLIQLLDAEFDLLK